jgi:hypothetical protein
MQVMASLATQECLKVEDPSILAGLSAPEAIDVA